MSGDWLAMGGVALLALAATVRPRKGSAIRSTQTGAPRAGESPSRRDYYVHIQRKRGWFYADIYDKFNRLVKSSISHRSSEEAMNWARPIVDNEIRKRRRRGSRTVDAYKGLRQAVEGYGSAGDLADYYEDTANDQMEVRGHEDVYWSGGYGVIGPTDGTMVPVQARYLEPMPENIFDFDKLATLVGAIEDGDRPIVDSGYAVFDIVERGAIAQSQESAEDIARDSWALPYETRDIGALTAMVRDGNHRSFAGLIAGDDVAWLRLSDSDKQDLIERKGERRIDKIYAAIRKAQRDYSVPIFTRPRLKRVRRTAGLDAAEERHAFLQAEIPRLERRLYQRYEHLSPEPSAHNPLERPGLFLRLLIGRIREQEQHDFEKFLDTFYADPDAVQERQLDKERMALLPRLRTLRQAAGLDRHTGERAYYR